jgi:hypothetical protein
LPYDLDDAEPEEIFERFEAVNFMQNSYRWRNRKNKDLDLWTWLMIPKQKMLLKT